MARIAVRRASAAPSTPVAGAIALALGLGTLLGVVLGQVAGPIARRLLRQQRRRALTHRQLVGRLVAEAQAALDDDVVLRDCGLQVIAVGPGRIELHGWVADRRSRAHAAHLVSDAIDAEAIINCVLVRGEDDDASSDDASDERLA